MGVAVSRRDAQVNSSAWVGRSLEHESKTSAWTGRMENREDGSGLGKEVVKQSEAAGGVDRLEVKDGHRRIQHSDMAE